MEETLVDVSELFIKVCVCVCVLQDKLKSLGIELDEEKSNVELLNDRIARSREQVHTHTQADRHTHTHPSSRGEACKASRK